jgi:hypothetical protein
MPDESQVSKGPAGNRRLLARSAEPGERSRQEVH